MFAACSSGDGTQATRTFDPCQPVTVGAADASDAQRASIDDAIALWHAAGVAAPLSAPGSADILVRFETAAPAIFGLYDDATIHINVELDGDARAIAIAHELGHAFGLAHVPVEVRPSVMNAGNLTIAPAVDDRVAIDAIWGTCTIPVQD